MPQKRFLPFLNGICISFIPKVKKKFFYQVTTELKLLVIDYKNTN